jgi:P27 family predicted phage terminase small subunit
VAESKLQPPAWLEEVAQQKWVELLAQIPDFDPGDADTLALLCCSWESYLAAQKDVRENGQTLTGDKGRMFINPAVNIVNEERKSILKISKLLGLAPDSKSKAAAAGEGHFAKLIDR